MLNPNLNRAAYAGLELEQFRLHTLVFRLNLNIRSFLMVNMVSCFNSFAHCCNSRYDYCQSNKWHRPGFSVPHVAGTTAGETACTCKIVLRREDPKSKEVLSVVAHDKSRVYVDAFQARNFGAVLALHRINWDKPMHRVLPPGYRDYWYDLEEERKQKVEEQKSKGHDILTAPDPFRLTQAAREHARAVEKAKREMEQRV